MVKNYIGNLLMQGLHDFRVLSLLKITLSVMIFGISTPAISQCTPPGDQVTYGEGYWIGYVYFPTSNPGSTPVAPFSSNYAGYLTMTPHFAQDYEYDAVWGPNICGGTNNNFAIRYKMKKEYAPGNYTFTVGGDDGYRLSLDGGATYAISNWIDHGYQTSTATVYLSGTVYLVLEYYENAVGSKVTYFDSSCTSYSTAPTTITGTTTFCKGSSTTLTASGGTEAPGATYQWGYGTTAGYYIISGQTGPTVTISPNQNEYVWVRRIDTGSCSNTTLSAETYLTVLTPSTAPTSISGTTTICSGASTTLTASGGTLASGGVYQWGTGDTIGSNIISGQTGAAITVSPTSSTTYWVRRSDTTCGFTSAITQAVTVAPPPGDPSVFGNNVWNVYAYSGADISLATPVYKGYYTQNTTGFNTQSGSTAWDMATSPSAAAGWNGCTVPNDNFTFVHKRRGFPCGSYTLTMLTGDDVCAVYIDGVQVFYCSNWSICSNANIGVFTLNENSQIEVRTREDGGGAHAALGVVLNSTVSTSPTAIAGTDALCYGQSTTLTASGGTHGTYGSYQWGTGTAIGDNIISGQNGASITVTPTASTAYWVRRNDGSPCPSSTGGVVKTVSVEVPPGNPATFGNQVWNVYGYSGNDISLATTIYAGYYTQNTVGFDTTGWSATASPSSAPGWQGCSLPSDNFTTVHKRKGFPCGSYTASMLNWDDSCVIYINGVQQWYCPNWSDVGSCNGYIGVFNLDENSEIEVRTGEHIGNAFTGLSLVNNTAMATPPTSVTGTNVICGGTPTTLTATGGSAGASSTYQWGTGNIIGSNIITGQTAATLTVSPLSTTTYWVRRINSLCETPTAGIFQTVTVPSAVTYANGAWSATPNSSTPINVTENLTISSNLHVCSCQVSSGATLTISSAATLTVEKNITVNSSAIILVENLGSIIQIDDAAINSGNISFKSKTTTMKQYDYNYWSSPVAGCTLQQLSPNTLFDKFFSFNPVINNWAAHLYGNQIMEPGKGYIVRAPQGWNQTNSTAGVYEGTFTGVPNNGSVSATIKKGTSGYNLIGNPYPSAIDLDLFLTDPVNAALLKGTIYIWMHNTAISNQIPGSYIYNYTRDDYAKYNLTGGVRTATSAVSGGVRPSQKLNSGQSFFIETQDNIATGTYSATFKNYMRISNNAVVASKSALENTVMPAVEKHRMWISISNVSGAYDETLLGYVSGATNAFDPVYDGAVFPAGNVVTLYSILDGSNLSIQGRALPFDPSDIIPLGYISTLGGTFTISLDTFDGMFANQNVYLFDHTTGLAHDLKSSAYTFITEQGTFNNRFELRFSDTALGTIQHNAASDLMVIKEGTEISLLTKSATIHSLDIFDLSGRIIYRRSGIDAQSYSTKGINVPAQMLLVKVTFADKTVATRKIIMN